MSNTSTPTTTVTLAVGDLQDLIRAAADSGCYWHNLYQDVVDGKRDDLNAEQCRRISRRSWDLWQQLKNQTV